jgi:hypothetical protein
MALHRGPKIVTGGLVLCLDAGHKKSYSGSGTTWTDASRNGHNATLNNSPTYDGLSIIFDGTDQYTSQTSLPSVNVASDSYTMELWFKFITLPTSDIQTDDGNGGPIYGQSYGSDYQLFAYAASDGKSHLGACYDDSRSNAAHKSTATISAGEWVQFVQIGNPSGDADPSNTNRGKYTYYINGVLDRATTLSSDSNGYSIPTTMHIAHDSRYNTNYSNLAMSAIHRYNRELTAEEILQNFNAMRGRFGL